jgi:hypothetical protein
MTKPETMLAALAALALAGTAQAQWPNYPTPEVPRTADGAVDLDGPTPRTADGHPDLSGLWSGRSSFGRGAAPPPAGPPIAGFRDVGSNIDGGLPFQDWARALRDEREATGSADNPEAHCLPICSSIHRVRRENSSRRRDS